MKQKKILIIILMMSMVVLFAACSVQTDLDRKDEKKLKRAAIEALIEMGEHPPEEDAEVQYISVFGISPYAMDFASKMLIDEKSDDVYSVKLNFWYKAQGAYKDDTTKREGRAEITLLYSDGEFTVNELEIEDYKKLSFWRQLYRSVIFSFWLYGTRIYIILGILMFVSFVYGIMDIDKDTTYRDTGLCAYVGFVIPLAYCFYTGFDNIAAPIIAVIVTMANFLILRSANSKK